MEAVLATNAATKSTENGLAPGGLEEPPSGGECKTAGMKGDDKDVGLGIAGFLTPENIQRLGLPEDKASQW